MVLEGDAGQISESQQQLLNEAFNSSERMVNLINDFLNVSRIQTGKFVIDKHAVDLSKIVEQEVNVVKPNAAIRCQKISYNKPKNFPIIDVDEGKIRQVVMNFIDNAIYYSHENSVIEINLSTSDNSVAFTVKDNGIGVPKSEQQELFTKFFRARNARTQRPDGTGVGLYLAKKIILAHEGRIIFETVEGKGSTFGFDLPLSKRQ
jgi:signal transduction histidine kinase